MFKELRNKNVPKHKPFALFLSIVFMIGLSGCGSSTSSTNSGNSSNTSSNTSENTTTKTQASDSYYKSSDGIYEIKSVEQMKGKYGDNQIIAITLNYTNTTDKAQSPWFAIALDMNATQETDKTVEPLNGANGYYPDSYKAEAVKMGDTDIKPGATVEAVVGYTLLYPGSPVYLRDRSFGDKDGTKFERIIQTTK
ncbi:MAG TPA: DUF5067 domain-containing protein [Clostridiaceae bacterium]